MIFDWVMQQLKREAFLTTPFGMLTNAAYFTRRGLYKQIATLAPEVKGDVLDFGCGSKPYKSLFRGASSYTGLDIAVSGHDHKNSDVDIYYDGHTIPIADNSMDAVVSFEVLEHVFNIDNVLTEIHRVLKPQGQLLVTLPFAWFEHEQPYDFARYTSFGLRHVMERNGFTVEILHKTTTSMEAICQLFVEYVANITRTKIQILNKATQILLVFPITLIAFLVCVMAPTRDDLFGNLVCLARK